MLQRLQLAAERGRPHTIPVLLSLAQTGRQLIRWVLDLRGCLENYTRWVHLVAAMLRGGFTAEETGTIAGGNYVRIFRAAVG